MHDTYSFDIIDILGDDVFVKAFKELDNLWGDYRVQFPPTDRLIEKETGNLVFRTAIAGYKPEDVSVTVEDNFIIIEGKSHAKDDDKYIVQSRGIKGSSFKTKYPLSNKFDTSKIEATFKNGILEISVPVAEEKKPKNVKINF